MTTAKATIDKGRVLAEARRVQREAGSGGESIGIAEALELASARLGLSSEEAGTSKKHGGRRAA